MPGDVHPGVSYGGGVIPCPGLLGICTVAPIDAATDGQQGCTRPEMRSATSEHAANRGHNIVCSASIATGRHYFSGAPLWLYLVLELDESAWHNSIYISNQLLGSFIPRS